MSMVYQWRKGARCADIDPQVAGDEINRLEKELDRNVEAADIVKVAKAKRSPLHSAFEWDDSEAARLFRDEQARDLIANIVVVYEEPGSDEPSMIRAFVHISGESGYTNTVTAMSDVDKRQKIVEQAWKDLQIWTVKYEQYKEFAEIVSTIRGSKKRQARLG